MYKGLIGLPINKSPKKQASMLIDTKVKGENMGVSRNQNGLNEDEPYSPLMFI